MTDRARPVGERRILVIGSLLVAVVLAIFAALIHRDRANAHDGLDDRFHARAELTATFARRFVDDLALREQRQAERLLAGPTVDQATFDQVVRSFDFDAAVLLDAWCRRRSIASPSPPWPRRTTRPPASGC